MTTHRALDAPLYAWPAAVAAALALCACAGVPEPETAPEEPLVVVAPTTAKASPPAVIAPAAAKPAAPAAVETKTNEVDALLADFERLRKLPPNELAREQEAARQAFTQTRSDAARIRLAMTMTVSGGVPGEETRALELLEPIVKNTAAPLHGLAFLLAAYVQEQRRIVAMAQGLQQNVQGLQQSNQTLQQNVHALQQKLDALRTLERSLSERGEPAPRRR
jgi:hypothetical protein